MPGDLLVEWGVRAEAAGFDIVGAISRLAYPSHEELITLAAIAGATKKIRLMPTVMVAPIREPALLAKQAATLDRISNGRLVLGMGVGMRDDDFTITETSHAARGKRFDDMLEVMHKVWRGESLLDGSREITPPPTNGDRVPIIFGANMASKAGIRRIAKWGEGFMAAGSPQMVQPIVDGVRAEWERLGRPGAPKLVAATYFTFGGDEEAERNARDYYAFMPAFGEMAVAAMAREPKIAVAIMKHFEDAGYDEFFFSAGSTDPSQIDQLAEALKL